MTTATCPGKRKPSTLTCESASNILNAGGTSFCADNMNKFFTPRAFAAKTVAAAVGAVVSKPTAKKIIFLCGLSSAICMQSSGEVFAKLEREPGTLSMSPNVAMTKFFRA